MLGAIVLGVVLGNSATSGIAPVPGAARTPRVATANDPARVASSGREEAAGTFDEVVPAESDRIFSAPPPGYEAAAAPEAKPDEGFDAVLDDGKDAMFGLDPVDDGAGE